MQQKRLSSYDGTDLCYYTGGKGPAVILANGLGGPFSSYRHIVSQLRCDYKLLSWDYRGTFRSQRPRELAAVSVDHHIRDMELLMEVEGIDEAVVLGWSMGVQVALEFYRRHPERVAGLVMLCGVAGAPFASLRGVPMPTRVMPPLIELGKRNAALVGRIAQLVTGWRGFLPLMQRVGLAAPSVDREVFREISQDFASVDVEVYCETLKQLGDHDARSVLQAVRVPTLLVSGDRDRMTPRSASERMHAQIDGSRLVVIEGGTHYTPVEFPERVATALDSFLREVAGYEPAPCRQSYS